MSEEKIKKDEITEDGAKQSENEPKPAKRTWFCAVIQTDFPDQTDCLRYMAQHPEQFPVCIAIIHDHDKFDAEDEEDAKKFEKSEIYVRKNGDGTESQFRSGDAKPPHIHLLLKMPRKMLASSLSKQFCNQIHFQDCSDEIGYAHYLTHNVFRARKKYQYAPADVCKCEFTTSKGWRLYCEMTSETSDIDLVDACEMWQDALRNEKGDMAAALALLCVNGQNEIVKKIASHSNFFDKYFRHT